MIPTAPPLLAPGFHGVPDGCLAAVVTALEMRAPPNLQPWPEPTGVTRMAVPAPPTDWYRALFRRVGAPWLWTSRLAWTDAALRKTLDDPAVEVTAVLPQGGSLDAAIGLVELDFRTSGECEVAFFGLATGWTGKGIGRWAMNGALARAWERIGTGRVWIHTCTLDDPAALPFYVRSGFTPTHRQVEILLDPRLSGALPRECAPTTPVIAASQPTTKDEGPN